VILLTTGGSAHYARRDLREIEITNSTDHTTQIFGAIQDGSDEVVKDANALNATLEFRDETLKASSPAAERVAAGAQRQAQALRDSMVLVFLDLADP
jgi:hypothetical protein